VAWLGSLFVDVCGCVVRARVVVYLCVWCGVVWCVVCVVWCGVVWCGVLWWVVCCVWGSVWCGELYVCVDWSVPESSSVVLRCTPSILLNLRVATSCLCRRNSVSE